ncbi:hypothetical protein B0O99DRAFT_592108 [Bisporella sp. PMI_857]|nr:hypothetical protein B0O99DRAFT_592108 [Bisporella sp. PMI_857]
MWDICMNLLAICCPLACRVEKLASRICIYTKESQRISDPSAGMRDNNWRKICFLKLVAHTAKARIAKAATVYKAPFLNHTRPVAKGSRSSIFLSILLIILCESGVRFLNADSGSGIKLKKEQNDSSELIWGDYSEGWLIYGNSRAIIRKEEVRLFHTRNKETQWLGLSITINHVIYLNRQVHILKQISQLH